MPPSPRPAPADPAETPPAVVRETIELPAGADVSAVESLVVRRLRQLEVDGAARLVAWRLVADGDALQDLARPAAIERIAEAARRASERIETESITVVPSAATRTAWAEHDSYVGAFVARVEGDRAESSDLASLAAVCRAEVGEIEDLLAGSPPVAAEPWSPELVEHVASAVGSGGNR